MCVCVTLYHCMTVVLTEVYLFTPPLVALVLNVKLAVLALHLQGAAPCNQSNKEDSSQIQN